MSIARVIRTAFCIMVTLCLGDQADGQIWTRPLAGAPTINGVDVVDNSFACVVGDSGFMATTTDGGLTWQTEYPLHGQKWALTSVDFIDRKNGMAVGQNGWILRTVDGGVHWTEQYAELVLFTSVFMIDSAKAVVVGAGGRILRTTDAGATWNGQGVEDPPGGWLKPEMGGVCFVSESRGYAVGGFQPGYDETDLHWGFLLNTTDGGVNWSGIRDGYFVLRSVSFSDPSHGWVAGYKQGFRTVIIRTTDGGATWREQAPGGWPGPLNGVKAIDSLRAIAVGASGLMISTRDGGLSWQVVSLSTTQMLAGVSLSPGGYGLAVGGSGLLRVTTDGGETWNPASITEAEEPVVQLPSTFRISECYPNPFNPTTSLRLENELLRQVDVRIFDGTGGEVATLVSRLLAAGTYEISWNAASQSSGVYYCRVSIDDRTFVRKMVLVR